MISTLDLDIKQFTTNTHVKSLKGDSIKYVFLLASSANTQAYGVGHSNHGSSPSTTSLRLFLQLNSYDGMAVTSDGETEN